MSKQKENRSESEMPFPDPGLAGALTARYRRTGFQDDMMGIHLADDPYGLMVFFATSDTLLLLSRLIELRNTMSMSRGDIASRTGWSKKKVREIETGLTPLTCNYAVTYALALGKRMVISLRDL